MDDTSHTPHLRTTPMPRAALHPAATDPDAGVDHAGAHGDLRCIACTSHRPAYDLLCAVCVTRLDHLRQGQPRTYWSWCDQAGGIHFGYSPTPGCIIIARGAREAVRNAVYHYAHVGWRADVLMVPGMQDARDDSTARARLCNWLDRCSSGYRAVGLGQIQWAQSQHLRVALDEPATSTAPVAYPAPAPATELHTGPGPGTGTGPDRDAGPRTGPADFVDTVGLD